MIKTLTIYPDYGMAPFAWIQDGIAESSLVGELLVNANEAPIYFPNTFGKLWKDWANEFDRVDPGHIDWNSFHATGLYLSAVTACWVASQDIVVRYAFPCEDPRVRVTAPHIWLRPTKIQRYLALPGLVKVPHEPLDAVQALWLRITSC